MQNPFTVLPTKVRTGMYVGLGLLGPAVPYALEKGWIGTAEVTLYGGYALLCGVTAVSNVPSYVDVARGDEPVPEVP